MGVSYTGETTMNEAAFRDVERSSGRSSGVNADDVGSDRSFEPAIGQNLGQWRDKIEVRLDNRQVFFLFFGSALCACMLFVLGVIVGKRLESRGRAAIPEVQDPLAVLDRLNGSAGPGGATANAKTESALTFPKALIGASVRTHGTTPVAPKPVLPAAPKAPPAAAKAPPAAPKVPPAAPKAPPATTPKATVGASAKLAATSAPRPALPAVASVSVAPAPPTVASPLPASGSTSTPASAKGKFTLVLSSFPERSDADVFAKRFAAQGAYVAVSEVPGKGNVYRVRVGSYASSQEAAVAKTAFEKQTNVIAYVAGR